MNSNKKSNSDDKKNSKGNQEREARIWRIRDSIQNLEDIKDAIINFLSLDNNSSSNAWIINAKEVYYSIVSAWAMLKTISNKKVKNLDSAKSYLALAKSRLEQCASELKALDGEGSKLESKLRNAFEKCRDAINTELGQFSSKNEITPPSRKVIKISETEYHLPCAICGKTAVSFVIGTPWYEKNEALICNGIVHGGSISLSSKDKIFSWLMQDQISEVHSYFKNNSIVFEEGIDAYCPECDKIYCGVHYFTKEEWDDGFYDCTYGTCPAGHVRIIHD